MSGPSVREEGAASLPEPEREPGREPGPERAPEPGTGSGAREVRLPVPWARRFAARVLEAAGASAENAGALAEALVDADMQGIGTHGLGRLAAYARRIELGLMDGRAKGRVVRRMPAAAAIDGQNGIGQVIGLRAMDLALEIAGEAGVGVVAVRRSNHFGVAGYFCERAAAAGAIGIAMTNSPSGIPPAGGTEPYFGTNPIAAAIPVAGRPPVVIDVSASVVARGNIIMAAKTGRPIPLGWAIDRDGNPTTDPEAAITGAVLPMAGHKGYALALLVEALAGVMAGAAFGPRVGGMYGDAPGSDTGHLFMAIDPASFGERDVFFQRMAQMASEIESVRPAPGGGPPRLPGDRRHANRQRSLKHGIEIPVEVARELAELGERLGVPFHP